MVFQLSKSLWWNCSSKEWSILKRSNVNLDKFRDKFDQFVSLFLQYGHIPFDVQLLKGVFKCRIVCKTICVAFLCILVICVVWTTHHLGFAMTKRGDVLLCRSSRLHQRMKSYLCSTSPLHFRYFKCHHSPKSKRHQVWKPHQNIPKLKALPAIPSTQSFRSLRIDWSAPWSRSLWREICRSWRETRLQHEYTDPSNKWGYHGLSAAIPVRNKLYHVISDRGDDHHNLQEKDLQP